MSHRMGVTLLVLGSLLAALPARAHAQPQARSPEERAVLAAVQEMIRASVAKDFDALERIYHDDLMYSHTVESVPTQTKAEVIADLRTPRIMESITFTSEPVVRIYDDVALVRVNIHQRNGSPGRVSDNYLHVLWVLIREPQGWQVAVRHPTRRMGPPAAASR